jgi:hypothetical protein
MYLMDAFNGYFSQPFFGCAWFTKFDVGNQVGWDVHP